MSVRSRRIHALDTVTHGFTAPAKPPVNRSKRSRHLLSIGGCNAEHLLKSLSEDVVGKHLWRVTLPSLMTPPLVLRRKHLDDPAASDFLVRECEKPLLRTIEKSQADAILIEFASDFAISHMAVGDSMLPDFRSDIFAPGWASISFDAIPELANATLVNVDHQIYWSRWLESFEKFYETVVKSKLRAGCKVIILARQFCETYLHDGKLKPFDHIEMIQRRNKMLKSIYAELKKYEGLQFIGSDTELLYSSSYAPYGGPWEFHPSEEVYAVWQSELAQALLGPAAAKTALKSTKVCQSSLLDMARSRSQLLTQLDASRAELQELARRLVEQSEASEQERASWIMERNSLIWDREQIAQEHAALQACAAAAQQQSADPQAELEGLHEKISAQERERAEWIGERNHLVWEREQIAQEQTEAVASAAALQQQIDKLRAEAIQACLLRAHISAHDEERAAWREERNSLILQRDQIGQDRTEIAASAAALQLHIDQLSEKAAGEAGMLRRQAAEHERERAAWIEERHGLLAQQERIAHERIEFETFAAVLQQQADELRAQAALIGLLREQAAEHERELAAWIEERNSLLAQHERVARERMEFEASAAALQRQTDDLQAQAAEELRVREQREAHDRERARQESAEKISPGSYPAPLSRFGFKLQPGLSAEAGEVVRIEPQSKHGAGGPAVYGPYKRLQAGKYTVRAYVAGTSHNRWRRGGVVLDIYSPDTGLVVAAISLEARALDRLAAVEATFDWPSVLDNRRVEFRLHQRSNCCVSLAGFDLRCE